MQIGKRGIFPAIFLIFLLVTLLPNLPRATLERSTTESAVDAKSQREKWLGKIEEVGAQRAYEEFKRQFQGKDFNTQHLAGHLFGEVLYQKEGVKGVAFCDETFAYACYHSFFGRAFAEKGLSIVEKMDKECIRKHGPENGVSCQHGIGHGLLENLGSERLVEALEACERTQKTSPIFGCTAGVFMEYNVPIIISQDNAYSKIRELGSDPDFPCSTLARKYRTSCYHEIVQLWDKYFDYEKIGSLCAGLDDEKEAGACFSGAGAVAGPSSDYDALKTIEKCKKMPTLKGEMICRSAASWAFYFLPEYKALSPKICEGMAADVEFSCATEADVLREE